MSNSWVRLASVGFWIALAVGLGALLVSRGRALDREIATRVGTAHSASVVPEILDTRVEMEQMLRARTLALEQLADQCAPSLWGDAEIVRDRASEAQEQGDRAIARERYDEARMLYAEAQEMSAWRMERDACQQGTGPTLELPPLASTASDGQETGASAYRTSTYEDPERAGSPDYDEISTRSDALRDSQPGASRSGDPEYAHSESTGSESPARRTAGQRIRAAFGAPRVADQDEVALRAEASALVEARRACDAVQLLRDRGESARSRKLARALTPACRAQRRGRRGQ